MVRGKGEGDWLSEGDGPLLADTKTASSPVCYLAGDVFLVYKKRFCRDHRIDMYL